MDALMDAVAEFLTDDKWSFDRIEEHNVISTDVKAENATYRLHFLADDKARLIMLYATPSNHLPEERRLAAADFLTRANFGLRIGNFELDMGDGQVRYKVSLDVEGGVLSPMMVKNMVGAAVTTFERYFAGLMSVCYAVADPVEAIQAIENPPK